MIDTLRTFMLFFALQFVSYLNLTINIRAIAHEEYAVAVVTDSIAPLIAWTMIRHIGAERHTRVGMAAVAAGGGIATVVGIWLTQRMG